MTSQTHKPASSSRPADHPSRTTLRLQTTGQSLQLDTRYSYQETPLAMQGPVFPPFSSPTNSTIDESPISPASPSGGLPGYDHQEAQRTPIPDEKAFEANIKSPPALSHPAFRAPVAEPAAPIQTGQQPRTTTMAQASPAPDPPLSPGPLPRKAQDYSKAPTPITMSTAFPDPAVGVERRVMYNPHALQGPNVGSVNHRPGQVSHPNASVDPHWKHGLCEPDTLCCMSFFCPCMLYGRTMYRLSRKSEKKDATDMLGYESCNGSCGLFAVGCGLQGILAAIHRTRIRKLYKIEGSFGSDCMRGFCCCCCVVAQNEREVKEREEVIHRHAGPMTGYVAPTGDMSYAPPPR